MHHNRSRFPRARVRNVLVATLAALASLIAIPTAPAVSRGPGSPSTPMLYGFNEDGWQYALQPQTGARIRRLDIPWANIQPKRSVWNWSSIDTEVAALHANGLRPLVYLTNPPCWSHPAVCDGIHDGMFLQDHAHDADWTTFVQTVARRYPDAVAIEIWNEENLSAYYISHTVDAYTFVSRYTQTVRLAHDAVKTSGARIPVLVGGLFAAAGTSMYSDANFVSLMYRVGLRGNVDGIAVHPYPTATGQGGTSAYYDPSVMEQTLKRVRAARNAAGDSGTPLWITEVGESTESTAPSASLTQQATDLVAMLRQAAADGDVRSFIMHRLIDRPLWWGGPFATIEAGFGAFTVDGTPKPAACAISNAIGGSLRCPAATAQSTAPSR